MTTEQNHAVLPCAPSAFLAIPEPGELTLHRWKPTNPLTTQGAARSRSWYARQGRRLPDGTGCGCLRGSLQLPIEVTSTSSFLLLPHKAFDLLASILLGIDLFWSFIFLIFFFYWESLGPMKMISACSPCMVIGLAPWHPGRACFTNAKGWKSWSSLLGLNSSSHTKSYSE